MIHHGLECCWGIGESEIHYEGFKEAIFGFEGRFVFVPFFDTDVVVPPSDIKL